MSAKGSIKKFLLANRTLGKRKCFMWDDEGLDAYLNWSFANDYLLVASGENGISGVAVAYPLATKCNMTIDSLLPNDALVDDENSADLCVMDWMASGRSARIELVNQFKRRYPNWHSQRKFGAHYSKVKLLSNTYLNKLNTI